MRRASNKTRQFWQRHQFMMFKWAEGHPPWINRPRPWLLLGRMVRKAMRSDVPPEQITDEYFGHPPRRIHKEAT